MTGLPTTQSISDLLDCHLPQEDNVSWYRAREIPEKKLKNALGGYASDATKASVLALGDGTVFGSAKEGILITADTLFSGTSEEKFSVRLQDIVGATKLGGWPTYGIELQCRDGSSHKISTTCFDKKQDGLVDFLNSIAGASTRHVASQEPSPVQSSLPAIASVSCAQETSIRDIEAGLKLIGVCKRNEFDDVGDLFEAAFRSDTEWPLLKGYCRYVGFNQREVDGVFLLTNQRLLLFSMEMGAKIVTVEVTRRLLDKVPVPFFDSITCFFLFSIPRALYVAMRGGKEKMIVRALDHEEEQLLSEKPPLRKVQEFDFEKLAENVAQVDVGAVAGAGILTHKFGVSFSPVRLAKTFRVPKDLILPEHEAVEPFERLLHAVHSTLARIGLDYRVDAKGEKLTITPAASEMKAAA